MNKTGATKKEQWFLQIPVMAACPLGVLLALALSGGNPLIQAVGLSMSAGTFLYVGAAEIISEEFASNKRKNMKTKIGFLFLGVIIICCVMSADKPTEKISDSDHVNQQDWMSNSTIDNSDISDRGKAL